MVASKDDVPVLHVDYRRFTRTPPFTRRQTVGFVVLCFAVGPR